MKQRAWLHRLGRLLFALLTRSEVYGLENVPQQGGAILAANHLGRLDAPIVFAALERSDATGLVADKYKGNFFFNWLVNAVGGIWVNREAADLHALRQARDFLQAGGILGIAPEGTRSPTGALRPAKTGVAYLADKAGVPIIPAGITGTEVAVREILLLRRPRLKVRFGKPFCLPALDHHNRTANLEQNTDEIMCQIAALLPEGYRGVYADYTRVSELERKGRAAPVWLIQQAGTSEALERMPHASD
jgi:1-acyl-sn-glycerol-3-phosphate acyltransferase